jgi:hypothetical protein
MYHYSQTLDKYSTTTDLISLYHTYTYMVTDDMLNYKSAKYYENLRKLGMSYFVSCHRIIHALYKEMKYLPGPTKLQLYNPADTDRVVIIKAQNLIHMVQSVA